MTDGHNHNVRKWMARKKRKKTTIYRSGVTTVVMNGITVGILSIMRAAPYVNIG